METRRAEFVVLGAGAVGTAAAYQLARRGRDVLLVEQFALGHNRGSSHGAARITRHSYADPHCARLMPEAFRGWRDLECDAGTPLFVRTGAVSIAEQGSDYVERVADNLKAIGVSHARMDGAAWARSCPAFATDPSHDVVFEPDGGMLAASRCLEVQHKLIRQKLGDDAILDETPIERIDLDSPRPVLRSPALTIEADRLIIAAGSWIGRLLPTWSPCSSLSVTRQQVIYLRPPEPERDYAVGRMPSFIIKGVEDQDAYYGMPPFAGMALKVARHGGPEVDPDRVDRGLDQGQLDELIRRFLDPILPGLAAQARTGIESFEICLYTVEPENRFRIGPFGGRTDVLAASACSGHGFKFSILVGRVLADLACDGETLIDIAPWRTG